jgi:hypothetical protein
VVAWAGGEARVGATCYGHEASQGGHGHSQCCRTGPLAAPPPPQPRPAWGVTSSLSREQMIWVGRASRRGGASGQREAGARGGVTQARATAATRGLRRAGDRPSRLLRRRSRSTWQHGSTMSSSTCGHTGVTPYAWCSCTHASAAAHRSLCCGAHCPCAAPQARPPPSCARPPHGEVRQLEGHTRHLGAPALLPAVQPAGVGRVEECRKSVRRVELLAAAAAPGCARGHASMRRCARKLWPTSME